ncbi:hypothetical protein [Xanthomonas hortorum]|nr:hypothetical protein [Xanthomonas hortorum]UUF02515.1 hypothetical protein NDY25_22200 [Xanthomonas hortorum pv. pelargonii]UUF02520.1 hypothetical protein NDY25_22225 [Xanthomonas hortorum pv. pelargonii]
MTEQGTHYVVDQQTCRYIARRGQYEPYRDERNDRYVDGPTQIDRGMQAVAQRRLDAMTIDRGQRVQGTFPESPGYVPSTSTPSTGLDL